MILLDLADGTDPAIGTDLANGDDPVMGDYLANGFELVWIALQRLAA